MPAGMQIWGPDGSMWVDTNSYLGRIYGQVTIGPGSGASNVWMAGLGIPFALQPQPSSDSWSDNNGNSYSVPVTSSIYFTNSGNTVNVQFTWVGFANPYATIYYGAY